MIELKDIVKTYHRGSETVYALKGIDLVINKGEFIAITGPSGSGKTTLLHIIGCLDKPTSGILKLNGLEVEGMSESELVKIRRERVGFIFQHFYLIPGLSVWENITLPLVFGRKSKSEEEISSLIESVGLKDRIRHNPNQLSGGEMQRVAIARAMVNNPEILLADEPTGNLDTENSKRIFELLKSLNKKGLSIIMITHNTELAKRADRVITLRDGKIVSDILKGNAPQTPH
jgi:ABC-type lipoprotein export system ATPase subunit